MKLFKRIAALLHGKRLSRMRVDGTVLIFNKKHDETVRDYYLYVVNLIADAARRLQQDAEIVIGNYDPDSIGSRARYKIDFQIEHTLVKKGGRGAEHAPAGHVPVPGDPQARYLVRIQDHDRLSKADAVIEYSRPNLINVRSSGLYPELASKLYYLAPLVYPIESRWSTRNRTLEVITLFRNPSEPRRKALLESLISWNPVCQNIRGKFGDVQSIYERTKILINVRQTDHHDTLEELRVLPALLSGAIVVSEDVPLRNEIPYRDFIYWAPLGQILELVKDVYKHYDREFKNTFSDGRLLKCLKQMGDENKKAATNLLSAIRKQGGSRG